MRLAFAFFPVWNCQFTTTVRKSRANVNLATDEAIYGKDHPYVALDLNNLAQLYKATNRLSEAESLMERAMVIFLQFTYKTGHPHHHQKVAIKNYATCLCRWGTVKMKSQID
jgi:hypothetical protein